MFQRDSHHRRALFLRGSEETGKENRLPLLRFLNKAPAFTRRVADPQKPTCTAGVARKDFLKSLTEPVYIVDDGGLYFLWFYVFQMFFCLFVYQLQVLLFNK